MRWLLRLLLFWAITGPLFYIFGLPYLLDLLSHKAQTQAYDQCKGHLFDQGLGGAASPITPDQGEKYCHCVSDGLILTKNDVFDLMQHKPAARLNTLAQSKADTCNAELMNLIAPPAATPAPNTPDASGLIHL